MAVLSLGDLELTRGWSFLTLHIGGIGLGLIIIIQHILVNTCTKEFLPLW